MDILPDIGPMIDDRYAQHDASRYALAVDRFSMGVGELLFKENRKHPVELLTDCFHACYASEVAIHTGSNATAASWWRDFFSGGTAAQLRGKTKGNQALSEAAVASLADSISDYVNSNKTDPSNVTFSDIVARNKSIKRAIENSKDEVELLVGFGGGQGLHNGRGGQLTRAEIMEMHALLARSLKLRDILELAGAMTATRKAKKKIKSEGLDHVDGVTTSGDLTRILPSEVMLLGDDLTEWNLLRKLSEEQTLALRKFSWKPACKGPIVVCIDGSASMDGNGKFPPIIESKAFALTMARIAKEENRYIVLVEFGGMGEQRELIMPPNGWNQLELLKWLEHFFDGGTCFRYLEDTIAKKWRTEWKCPKGKTDIFIVTDAEVRTDDPRSKQPPHNGYIGLPRKTIEAFNSFREREKVKCYGLVIGHKTGNMDLVCDKTWITQSMGLESQAVMEILST